MCKNEHFDRNYDRTNYNLYMMVFKTNTKRKS